MNNFKARCTKGCEPAITEGKEYEVKGGHFFYNNGTKSSARVDSVEQMNYMFKAKFELVEENEMKQFTKADLRTGMRVETRDGDVYIVLLDTEEGSRIVCNEGWNVLDSYENALIVKRGPRLDIMKVYSMDLNHNLLDFNCKGSLLWQRTELKKMTHKEIETALGYEIEIVKGDK